MRNPWVLAGMLLAVAIAGLAVWNLLGGPSYANYPPREGPIVAFGDSLVQGVGATEGNDFVSRVSRGLNEPIVNLGVSGDTTRDGLARVDEAVARHPSIVLILLGGNDYLKRIPREETFQNLRTIVKKFQDDGALTVVLGVRGGLLSDNYADGYERLAKDTRSVYVSDVLRNLIGNRQYMSDQIHPNDQGYAAIAERVFAAIRPVLR